MLVKAHIDCYIYKLIIAFTKKKFPNNSYYNIYANYITFPFCDFLFKCTNNVYMY